MGILLDGQGRASAFPSDASLFAGVSEGDRRGVIALVVLEAGTATTLGDAKSVEGLLFGSLGGRVFGQHHDGTMPVGEFCRSTTSIGEVGEGRGLVLGWLRRVVDGEEDDARVLEDGLDDVAQEMRRGLLIG